MCGRLLPSLLLATAIWLSHIQPFALGAGFAWTADGQPLTMGRAEEICGEFEDSGYSGMGGSR